MTKPPAEPGPDAPRPAAPEMAVLFTPTPQRALSLAVADIERHAAQQGWDGPVYVFALVNTAQMLAADPSLAQQLPPEAVEAAQQDPYHLTSVEQDGLPEATDLNELLAQLAWPPSVTGAAVCVERVMVPPEAEKELPADERAAIAALMAHPQREDVRIVVGALRSGETWCAVRMRSHDSDDAVVSSADAVPGLLAALQTTFEDLVE